jgi:hypothetical protein
MLIFFASNADSYSAVADTKCNHTCSFMGCDGGMYPCEGYVLCCKVEDLPCTTDETWEKDCFHYVESDESDL